MEAAPKLGRFSGNGLTAARCRAIPTSCCSALFCIQRPAQVWSRSRAPITLKPVSEVLTDWTGYLPLTKIKRRNSDALSSASLTEARDLMRYLLLIGVLALPILVGFGSRSTAASRVHSYTPSVRQDVYCLQGRSWGYPGNCQFSTYSQCMATASGTHAHCGINPIYAFERQGRQQR